MSGSQNHADEAALGLDNVLGPSDQELPQQRVIQERSEQLLTSEEADEQHPNDFCNDRRCVVDCLLKNSICRSVFHGEKFLSLAHSLMERVVSCYDEKIKHYQGGCHHFNGSENVVHSLSHENTERAVVAFLEDDDGLRLPRE